MTQKKQRVRSIFMSDFHMGYKGFDAKAAIDFLETYDCQIIYLLGDIIDGWKFEKRWYWNHYYTHLIDLLVERQKQGVKILMTPGNHDEKLRDPFAMMLRPLLRIKYGLRIDDSFIHTANDGKQYLMIHGDQFDTRIVRGTSKFADRIYLFLSDHGILSPRIETTIENGKRKRWSLGKAISKNGGALLHRLVEAAAARVVKDRLDGIIYGHSHVAMLDNKNGVMIANCGSWTVKQNATRTNHTAIIENDNGSLEMIEWPILCEDNQSPAMQKIQIEDVDPIHKETKQIAQIIHDVWCKKTRVAARLDLENIPETGSIK